MLSILKFFRSSSQLRITRQAYFVEPRRSSFLQFLSRAPSNSHSLAVTREVNASTQFDELELTRLWGELFSETTNKNTNKKTQYPRYVDVILPDTWVRHFLVQIPGNIKNRNDIQAAVQRRFEALYDDNVQDWVLKLDLRLNGKSLVCAIPKALQNCLKKNAHQYKQSFLSIQSNFVQLWNAERHFKLEFAWVLVCDGETMTLAIVANHAWQFIRQISLPVSADMSVNDLYACMSKEAMMLGVTMPESLIMIGDIPSYWKTYGQKKNGRMTFEFSDMAKATKLHSEFSEVRS